jgi:hypothetical protein
MLIVVEKNESGEDGEAYSSLSIKQSGRLWRPEGPAH